MSLETLVERARALGKESQHVAAAASVLCLKAASLCVHCADKPKHRSARVWRLPRGGECEQCSYVGHDCLVVEEVAS